MPLWEKSVKGAVQTCDFHLANAAIQTASRNSYRMYRIQRASEPLGLDLKKILFESLKKRFFV